MKVFRVLVLVFLIAACGSQKDNTDNFDIKKRYKMSDENILKATETIDLQSKGVGPIQKIVLDAAIDPVLSNDGKGLFNGYCTMCHKIDEQFVGPALRGVTQRRSPEWIMNMILNPGRMVRDDSLAKAVFMEFNGSPMTNLGFEESEARAVLEYLRTETKPNL